MLFVSFRMSFMVCTLSDCHMQSIALRFTDDTQARNSRMRRLVYKISYVVIYESKCIMNCISDLNHFLEFE